MKLPIIKHAQKFIAQHDEDYIRETIEVIEHMTEAPGVKDEELDVFGELLSNLYGAIEVNEMIKDGKTEREALNEFMQRVMGSIDN